MNDIQEQIIIGSGPAGLSAAIYSARASLNPLLFAGSVYGGLLMQTTEVENYAGFRDGIMGPELMQNMIEQSKRFGTEIIYKNVTKVDFSEDIKKVYVDDQEYLAKTVIIATGSSPRKLGIESEDKLWGKGVSACATCDGAFYRGKVVAVIGGGDSAMEEATFLTKFASKVYLVHRREAFKASEIMVQRAKDNEKIEILYNSEVKVILGEELTTGLKLFDNKKQEEYTIDVDGMFLAIGHIPNVGFLENAIELDDHGFIRVMDSTKTETSVKGVFVAGDVHDQRYQQAITAAAMGCMASLDAEKYLESL